MGVVNLTPDSFSDGGQFHSPQQAVNFAIRLLDEGADIVDLGAESTRPGAVLNLGGDEERRRLAPVLEGILRIRPRTVLSVDTFRASTARFAVENGAQIVNDVSGMLWDAEMSGVCAEIRCGVVVMHTRGLPSEWASQPPLAQSQVLPEVLRGLSQALDRARHAGVSAQSIVIDAGFGFGKRGAENLTLLRQLAELHSLGYPLLVGLSRKGFLAPAVAPADRLAATVAANTAAIFAGAHLLRVHDVAAARQAAAIADALL